MSIKQGIGRNKHQDSLALSIFHRALSTFLPAIGFMQGRGQEVRENKCVPFFSFFFFVMALMFHSQAYAGGNYWSVSVDNEIALSETKIILMTVINSVDPVLNECEKISVQIAKPEGFIVWVISIFNIKDKDTEKTHEAIMLLNKKNARSELALFGYIGGGLKSSGENECVFTSKRLEIDNSKEGLSPVIFAFN